MPREQPVISWHHLRLYCEKFTWTDPVTGLITEGYNPPKGVVGERVPFNIRYITLNGNMESGRCICLKVDNRKHLRLVQFVDSGEIRWIRDYLVMEVNGTRFVTRSIHY